MNGYIVLMFQKESYKEYLVWRRLKVETAGSNGGKPEAELTAITKQESNEIIAIFNEVKKTEK